MIGNDVIDLQAASGESFIDRKGWLSKLFTDQERSCIEYAQDRQRMVWLLWSMKEAAYKIINRQTRHRFYAPLSFCCQLAPPAGRQQMKDLSTGFVTYRGTSFDTLTYERNESIHTIAVYAGSDTELIRYNVLDSYSSSQRSNRIISLLINTPYRLVKKPDGYPAVQHQVSGIEVPASMSHHGKYLAVTWIGEK